MTALLTCNIGDIDDVQIPVEQSIVHDYFCYNENKIPYPLPNLNDRLKGKYLKINSHRFLENYSNYIWIDGRVQVISSGFVSLMTKDLDEYDVVISDHYERETVYEEISFIKQLMNDGNEYLLSRYRNEPFEIEENFYSLDGLPKDYPIYACTVFARRNTDRVNRIFNEWWMRTLEFTCFDQAMFSYVAWRFGLKVKVLYYKDLLNYVQINKHKIIK